MNRLYSLALFVLFLSAITYGIIEWRSALVEQQDVIDDELSPDFIAETLKSNIYTDAGQLSHTIEADRMEHYSSLAVTHFELPNYTLHPKDNSEPWQLSANEATLYKDNRVVLNHRVRLKATDINSIVEEIHCKYLELDLTTNIISSEQTVMVLGKDFTMYGSGLIIDLNTKQMTLTEHVRTIYKENHEQSL
ncbi:LPS export ABC transporter periplasmic protein LptC [Litorilituus sediminis]|uniref:Lipopolysaccharide export system protein LptC n=1 Tax=Litorilituus sediminis TaxID=718192 RepID=A0A4P6PAK7_9GAMM|nr:LPS export ABC transporter periplasmic protein LptC [Litorilituus sediminis]QBG36627.1 LPS export ABC transporter periplasmic protein LptC [Litorilituus sediminis]